MKVLSSIAELRSFRDGLDDVGLVPTMGAFHGGHLRLMSESVKECKTTIVSLYVNPMQFDSPADFNTYPRDSDTDLAIAERAGVDAAFVPEESEMVAKEKYDRIPAGIAEQWEGEHRPGHLAGVATVVLRLFTLILPQRAYFGEKDLQQCAVIRCLIREEELNVELRTLETVREQSGLAMSSRNELFSAGDREKAARLYHTLQTLAGAIRAGLQPVSRLCEAAQGELDLAGFDVQYLAYVDPETMRERADSEAGGRLIVAAVLSGVRLIDNVVV